MTTDSDAAPEVVDLLRTLLRFDTTNRAPGDAEGELEAAGWVHGLLADAGWSPVVLAPDDTPRRTSVVVRVRGSEAGLESLLVHGHLDVVPADEREWSVDPFAGEVRDGYVVGRGATDMKDMCAAMLAVLLDWARSGQRPRRDVVMAFVADEETGGRYGAEWLVAEHPELFAGVTVAIGESGGVVEEHLDTAGKSVRLARIAAGERGTMHVTLTARGTAGHGSRPGPDNPVLTLVRVLMRIGSHRWPVHLSPVVAEQIEQTAAALGIPVDLGSDDGVDQAVAALGSAADAALFTVRASTTPTVVRAGQKVNVVPSEATAQVDVRCPPGFEHQLLATLKELCAGQVELEHDVMNFPVQSPTSGPWVEAMTGAVRAVDPSVVVVPGCLGGGTDAKAFASGLGIDCYGFAPGTLDPDGRLRAGMHGVDERVPVASLEGGVRILTHFLESV